MHWNEIASVPTAEHGQQLALPQTGIPDRTLGPAPAGPDPVMTRPSMPRPEASPQGHPSQELTAHQRGLGCLEFLFVPGGPQWTDVVLNGNGVIWGRPKHSLAFECLDQVRPSPGEVWQALEALLSPLGRACTEASPSVDAKIPRDAETGFPGARLKILHPAITPGDGYPAFAIRFFEQKPVTPQQIVEWGMAPDEAMDLLVEAVTTGQNILIAGGTGTGKTTLLSALCHGIPMHERIVKIEDPEEIWLPHPDVVTLEARPAPPGSPVPSYSVTDGVNDAMRLAPSHIIVGEVRTGTAALSLFRALMSDHSGLTTFHANGPTEVLSRLGVIMFSDANVPFDASRSLFRQAIHQVVHIGFENGQRTVLGIHRVQKQGRFNRVTFECVYPGPSGNAADKALAEGESA